MLKFFCKEAGSPSLLQTVGLSAHGNLPGFDILLLNGSAKVLNKIAAAPGIFIACRKAQPLLE